MTGQKRILVVDDTEATRYAVARTLRANGYETIEAGTGREALQLASEIRPDLITLDIHLPDMLGFEVCRRIKASPATSHIPVLQVSASYVSSKDRVNGLEGGADGYLTHPFEPAVLLATVRALLRAQQLNEDLRQSEERFRVALKNAPIMIYTCDEELRYTWIYNPPAPLTPADFLGRDDAALFTPTESAALGAVKREVLRTATAQRLGMALVIAGMDRFFDLTVEPFLSAAGASAGLTVACIDVTQSTIAERAQKRATEEAELANQAKTRFLANMSHEIRTPLGIIQGFADLALAPETTPEEREEYLLTIRRNAANLTKLLGEILDLSKVEAGRIEIEKTRFRLRELVTEVVAAFQLQAKERGIFLAHDFTAGFPEVVESDPTRIRQILVNLVSNALKFTLRGSVLVHGRVRPARPDEPSRVVEFLVTDTGIGITEDQKGRLFQRFSQADSSTTRRFGGTGLGLNLSQQLARTLGGELSLLKSTFGQGSVFDFSFDAGISEGDEQLVAVAEVPRHATPGDNDQPIDLSGMRILLVEDTIDNQMLVSRYIRKTGATVEVASDGIEGIAIAAERPFDVILMDVQMPNLDGYEATAALRARGLVTPIVALTANAMKGERDRALAGGFTDYLIKPLSFLLLVDTLKKYRAGA